MSDDLTLDPDNFAVLANVVERHSGIELTDEARPTLERRLTGRVLASGFTCYRDYVNSLAMAQASHVEIQTLIEQLTIKETYFLREALQIQVFVDEVTGKAPGGDRLGSHSSSHTSGQRPE